jgi:outer membrane protein assembly factor BamA
MMDYSRLKNGCEPRGWPRLALAICALAVLSHRPPAAAQVPPAAPSDGAATAAPPGPPAPAPAAPVSPLDGKVISEIAIQGLDVISESYIRNQIRTRVGEGYSQDQVQRDVARLLRTGRFRDVRAVPQLVNDQVRLLLEVAEKPEVSAIEFEGNIKFKDADLLKELPFAAGDPLDLYEVRQGRDSIERLYREKGYACRSEL